MDHTWVTEDAAKYAKIKRVGGMDQQVPLIQIFWNFHNIVMEHQSYKISEEKHFFLNLKKYFTIEIAWIRPRSISSNKLLIRPIFRP